jgi:hypothetical protein
MGESRQYKDGSSLLVFKRPDAECRALESLYDGLRFNEVRLWFLPNSALQDNPARDDLEILFNVSGSPENLTRYCFAHDSWWPTVPGSGISHRCGTEGFGRAWRVFRTAAGYRLQGANYSDGLTKLTVAVAQASRATQSRQAGKIGQVR